jgi:hypothetical protein
MADEMSDEFDLPGDTAAADDPRDVVEVVDARGLGATRAPTPPVVELVSSLSVDCDVDSLSGTSSSSESSVTHAELGVTD